MVALDEETERKIRRVVAREEAREPMSMRLGTILARSAHAFRRWIWQSFPRRLEIDFIAYKHESLGVSMFISATVTSALVTGYAVFVTVPMAERLSGTLLPSVAVLTTLVQAGLAAAHWILWLLLRWKRTAVAAHQYAEPMLILLGLYGSLSFPLMPQDRLLQMMHGASWKEQVSLRNELHPSDFRDAECNAWLHPSLVPAAEEVAANGHAPCFHDFPDRMPVCLSNPVDHLVRCRLLLSHLGPMSVSLGRLRLEIAAGLVFFLARPPPPSLAAVPAAARAPLPCLVGCLSRALG